MRILLELLMPSAFVSGVFHVYIDFARTVSAWFVSRPRVSGVLSDFDAGAAVYVRFCLCFCCF